MRGTRLVDWLRQPHFTLWDLFRAAYIGYALGFFTFHLVTIRFS